jgi:hypothetical protein
VPRLELGAETPFSYWYDPFNKGHSKDWKIPPYDPERAKKLPPRDSAAWRLRRLRGRGWTPCPTMVGSELLPRILAPIDVAWDPT